MRSRKSYNLIMNKFLFRFYFFSNFLKNFKNFALNPHPNYSFK